MITEVASMIIVPTMAFAIKKQLEINEMVKRHESDLPKIVEDTKYTRDRVDAIFDHLIEKDK